MSRAAWKDDHSLCLRLCRMWIWSSNPIVIGLLIYVVIFQNVLTQSDLHQKCQSGSMFELRSMSSKQRSPESAEQLIPVDWKPFSRKQVTTSYPIFVTSLPKSGTTSVWKYFVCGGQKASHAWITRGSPTKKKRRKGKTGWISTKEEEPKPELAGRCIHENIKNGKPPFNDCGEYDVYTDTGVSQKMFACFFILAIQAWNLICVFGFIIMSVHQL